MKPIPDDQPKTLTGDLQVLIDRTLLQRKTDHSIKLLKELIAIPSSNPHISDRNEIEIARFLREELVDAGLKVELQRVTSRPYWKRAGTRNRTRYNVIARTGDGDGVKLILNGHIDTVSGDTMRNAFDPRVVGDKLYGRGSADMKGGVASIIAATETIHETSALRMKGEVVLSLVVDEETLGRGTQEFIKREQGDFAVVAEPTQNTLGTAQAGYLDFNIHSKGLSCHGQTAIPRLWANAFVQTINICNMILEDHSIIGRATHHGLQMENTFNFTPTPFTPPPSYAWATMLDFTVNCLLGLTPKETFQKSKASAKRTLKRIRSLISEQNRKGLRAKFELLDLKPGFIQKQNSYTTAFQNAMRHVLGHRRESYVLSFCDATYFYQAGIPTVLFGPGRMELGHSVNEHTSIREVRDATSVFTFAIANIMKHGKSRPRTKERL